MVDAILEAEKSGEQGSVFSAAMAPETFVGTMSEPPGVSPEERLAYLKEKHTSALLRERGAPSAEVAKRFAAYAEELSDDITDTERNIRRRADHEATKDDERIPEDAQVSYSFDDKIRSAAPAKGEIARIFSLLDLAPSTIDRISQRPLRTFEDLDRGLKRLTARDASPDAGEAVEEAARELDEMVRESAEGE